MNDVTQRKAQLEARLTELGEHIREIEDQLDDPVSRDWEDRAVERESDEVLEGMGNLDLKEIAMIRAALARIEDGSYGICAKCGGDISQARLDVVPETPFCKACA